MQLTRGPSDNIDWLYQVRSGRAFGMGGAGGPVVGERSHLQLYNPPASGRLITVFQAWGRLATAGRLNLRFYDTALASLLGAGVNLTSGGAAGVGVLRSNTSVTELGTIFVPWQSSAADSQTLLGEWGVVLGEGEGLLIGAETVNVHLLGGFLWVET